MTIRRTVAVLTVAAGVLSGCGIPTEDTPRAIDPPHGPLAAAASPTSAATSAGPVTEQLFLVKDGMLVGVARHTDSAPTVNTVVKDLLAGPTAPERATGITSALLGSNVVAAVRIRASYVVVDLASAIDGTARNDDVLAYAQLVCTLTDRPDVNGVTFTRGGQPIGVPRADGSLSEGPLTTADYIGLMASPSPSPHTT
jgi:hypothetical protein